MDLDEEHQRRPAESLDEWAARLPRIIVSSTAITGDVSRAAKRGLLRRIGPRLYTPDLTTPLETFVRDHAIPIAAARFPGAVVSHRSALEMRPARGYLFLTGAREQTDRLPGLTIRLIKGHGPQVGDTQVMGLWRASDARAFLENLKRTRKTEHVSRALPRVEIEERLEKIMRLRGERGLNALRDDARGLAAELDMNDAFEILDDIIGTLLSTRTASLTSPIARARGRGDPYDETRVQLFERLLEELETRWADTSRPVGMLLRVERQNRAFVDAYFSNFIEGTRFEIDEAAAIAFEDAIPAARPQDAHDIKGTYELLVDARQMRISAAEYDSLEDFEHLLQSRHRTIMRARPEMRPGEFKSVANRAGNTLFVLPELVRGTLRRGFELFERLATPFQRAAFIMFLVAEVHPFDDGNGRLARAMMNAEFTAGEQAHIIIVTAYRDDYFNGLRILSRRREPNDYVRMLDRAQEFTSRLDFGDIELLKSTLERCNAFDETGLRPFKMPPLPAR